MTTSKTTDGKIWLYGLLVMVTIFLAGMTFSLIKAAREVSRVVDRDYYNHGLLYAPSDVAGAAARLGWQAAPLFRNGRLEIRITDRNGAPVAGGTLTVTMKGAGAPGGTLTCEAPAPGLYSVPLIPVSGSTLKAEWLFRRGSETMNGGMTVLP